MLLVVLYPTGQIRKRLKDNNVFLLKEWQVNMKGIKHDHIYMSLKLINNIWVLIEAKMAPEAANIEVGGVIYHSNCVSVEYVLKNGGFSAFSMHSTSLYTT